jgi:hypothetical protein
MAAFQWDWGTTIGDFLWLDVRQSASAGERPQPLQSCHYRSYVVAAGALGRQVVPGLQGLTRTLSALAIAAIPASDLEPSRVSQ